MQAEIEAVFLDINKDELRKKLEEFGAELVQPERLMRRTAFDLGRHEFARVRNEGDKVTMTYKCFTDNTITVICIKFQRCTEYETFHFVIRI